MAHQMSISEKCAGFELATRSRSMQSRHVHMWQQSLEYSVYLTHRERESEKVNERGEERERETVFLQTSASVNTPSNTHNAL